MTKRISSFLRIVSLHINLNMMPIVFVKSGEQVLTKVIKPVLIPSEMVMIKLSKDKLANIKEDIVVSLEDR